MIHELKCRFCDKVTGQIEIPKRLSTPEVLTNEHFNITDIRCDDCELENGNFKEMSMIHERDMAKPYSEFLIEFEKHGYKADPFIDQMIFDRPIRFLGLLNHDSERVQTRIDKIIKDCNLEELPHHERVAFVDHLKKSHPESKGFHEIPHESIEKSRTEISNR